MYRASMISMVVALAGCASTRPCDYLIGSEWTSASKLPALLQQEPDSRSGRWYTRESGSYLHCPASRSARNCGNIRVEYQPTKDGYENSELLVCMT
jgi:hypothetical protein